MTNSASPLASPVNSAAAAGVAAGVTAGFSSDFSNMDIDVQAAALTLHLVPQIPPRDAISTHSWLGGRPRLDPGAAWPEIREVPGQFIAQIACADLPAGVWDGLGPRRGSLALFIHPRDGDAAFQIYISIGQAF